MHTVLSLSPRTPQCLPGSRTLPPLNSNISRPIAIRFSAALAILVLTAATAGAQSAETSLPLARHTPHQVLNGEAIRISHYNPEQKLRLAIFVTPRDLAGQEKLLNELQDKNSPNFHKFLSAEEWDARFGPRVEDEQAVVDWVNSQGLTVTNRFSNRMLVDVEATSGAIEKALNVTINRYQVGDEVDFSNDRDPSIPAHLSGIIGGIFGLENIERVKPVGRIGQAESRIERAGPHPDYLPGPVYREAGSSRGEGDPTRAPWAQAAAAAGGSGGGQGTPNPPDQIGTMDPQNLYSSEGYSLSALYHLSKCCNVHNDSGGSPADTSIALVTFANYQQSDVNTFFKYYGLAWNTTAFEIDGAGSTATTDCTVGASGCPGLGDDDEADLDVEWSTAFSNSFGSSNDTAHVYVYEAGLGYYSNWFDVWNYVLTDRHAHVASTSWAWTEDSQQSGDPGWMTGTAVGDAHYIFNALAGQGNTLIAAAGDQGPTSGCNDADEVFWPANDPDFLAAGGTSLTFNYDGTFANETSWVGGPTLKNCQKNGGGGGGGVSKYFSAPSWQSGIKYEEWTGGKQYIVSNQPNRMMPDLSLNATGDFQWYYCTDPACPTVTAANGWAGVGGTSIVAPELAGFFVQVNSYLNSIGHICGSSGTSACEPIGNATPLLYWEGLGHGYAPHDPFYDTTQDCVTNYLTMNDISLTYFCAETGYDLATGWGSANLLQLAWMYNWNIIPADGVPAVQFSGPAKNTWYNTDQVISWTVSDSDSSSTPGLPAPGVAGFTQGWDSIPSDPYTEPHGGSGNSFYSGPQYAYKTKGCLSFQGAGGCSYLGSPQGCHTVHVEGWDNQGNGTGDKTYGSVCYDTVAPTISASTNPSTSGTVWVDKSVVVTLTATDPGGSNASGIYKTYYGINTNQCYPGNTGPCSVYSGPFTISTPGQTYIYYWTQDKAGNVSANTYIWVSIDENVPVTTASLSGTVYGTNIYGNIYDTAVGITLSGSESPSGVAHTYYILDGGSTQTYSGSALSVSTIGLHSVQYWSVSVAGEVETTHTTSFTIYSPTTATLVATPNPSVLGQSVKMTATIKATLSGTPTGSVTFWNGATNLGTGTLSGGVATLSTTALPAGDLTLQVSYAGAGSFIATNSAPFDQTVESKAALTSPTPSTVLAGPKVTFSWSAAPGATGYGFRLGTSAGSNNVYASGLITAASTTASNLPSNGETLYARLYTYFGSSSLYTDYVFTAATAAALTSPTPSTTLTGSTVSFTWSAGNGGVASYAFRIGTTVGGNNLYGSGTITALSRTVANLPTNGETLYARLYTNYTSGATTYTDYTFTAFTTP